MYIALSSPDEQTAPLVNLRELAVYLRTTRQTLSVWLDRWPDFPVITQGTNGRQYQFNAADVVAFLRSKKDEQARSSAERDQALAQLAFPFEVADEPATGLRLSAKDQMEAIKLRRMQREEAERSGQLVEAVAVTDLLTTCFTTLQRTLRAGIRQAGIEHNLPSSVVRALEARLAEAQRALVSEAGTFLRVQRDALDA